MKKIQVIGNITRDAQVNEVNGRKAVNFSVAVNESYKNKEGQKVESATFFNCSLWRDSTQSTTISQYLKKGTKVFVEGIPSAEIYKTKDNGHGIDMRILVREVELLGSKKEGESNSDGSNESVDPFNPNNETETNW